MSKALPKRHEVPKEYTWDLEAMYPSNDAWEEDFKKLQGLLPQFAQLQGKLGESPAELLQALQMKDRIDMLRDRLYSYARMRRDEDNTNSTYVALEDRAAALAVQAGSVTSFVVPEILALPGETIEAFLQSEPELGVYRHYLEDLARQKAHVLSAREEQILAMGGELAMSPYNIFTMLNNADMKFGTVRDERGNEVQLTHGRYTQLMESPDRRVRQETFRTLYAAYEKHKNTLAAVLNANVKKDIFYARVRKYNSALEAALDDNNIPVTVYENLIRTVRENLEPFYRYMKLRKKMLGVDELHMYDIYVPIVAGVDMQIPYEDAAQTVQEALRPLGDEYVSTVAHGIRSRWIDVYENEGKRSGAYSGGAYGTHPYILMNYQDNLDNMYTLAHELGHSMHTYYTHKNQPFIYADYTIFVAEVASTVNEALLTHYLLQRTTDKKERMYLLNHYLEQFRGTVYRQTMFAEFEKLIHEKVEAGEALTPELLSKEYRALNETYYGPDVVSDPQIELEWSRIPHFYYNFYVYQYATGFSAAIALSQRILEEGEPAVDRYLGFLKGGRSKYSIDLLKGAGVDMTSPEPVRAALRVFADLVSEMEALAGEAVH